eukprot:gnl/Trimastix_PCT/975.p1 GENE.gnl/Trimastix_PCT/975~~gnl/Trimastix_PCT/975.p1  ORF type:complete len:147 (+),score=9.92 gnl/Trimastix_PCT/975:86-526(+)
MLPHSLLRTAIGRPMLVELKNGETYNGNLVNCDSWMNLNLSGVICTSKDGDKFWNMPMCFIRGNTIKYIRVPDNIIDLVSEQVDIEKLPKQPSRGGHRGGRGGGRGGDRGGRGGRGGRGRGRGGDRGRGRGFSRGGRGGGRGGQHP